MTNYEKQANDFLQKHGLQIRITLKDSKPAPWQPAGHHYRVRLWGGELGVSHREITFDFWGSKSDADAGTDPTAYDVLACISSDTNTPETFKEFCSELGYGEDSISTLQTFKRADSFAKRLRAFFTPEEIDQLGEIQ